MASGPRRAAGAQDTVVRAVTEGFAGSRGDDGQVHSGPIAGATWPSASCPGAGGPWRGRLRARALSEEQLPRVATATVWTLTVRLGHGKFSSIVSEP